MTERIPVPERATHRERDGMQTVECVRAYLPRPDGAPGEAFFIEESAVVELLADDVLFVNSRRYVDLKFKGVDPENPSRLIVDDAPGEIQEETLVLFVGCNDLFAWGTVDSMCVTLSELQGLYDAWKAGGDDVVARHRAVERWCCLKAKMRPQYCVEQSWRKAGFWDEALEALPARATDNFGNPKIEPRA
jgi:hypothetical protein